MFPRSGLTIVELFIKRMNLKIKLLNKSLWIKNKESISIEEVKTGKIMVPYDLLVC